MKVPEQEVTPPDWMYDNPNEANAEEQCKEVDKSMDDEIVIQEPKSQKPVPTGDYTGVVTDAKWRDVTPKDTSKGTFKYLDLTLKINELQDVTIVHSVAGTNISPNTQLGRYVSVKKALVPGAKISREEIAKLMVGLSFSFSVIQKIGKEGTKNAGKKFPNVAKDSFALVQ